MSDALLQLTSADFDAVTAQGVVLVDFWATWCVPCKAQLPILEKLAPDYAGRVTIAKVNIEDGDNKSLLVKFGIRSIPTLLLFKDGHIHQTLVSLQTEPVLRQTLDAVV